MNLDILKRKLNNLKEWFALLGVFAQLSIIIFVGFVLVMLSGLLSGSFENSYLVFIDPPSLFVMHENLFLTLFSFVLMLFGLVITGFIISVLSSWLENTFRDIRSGRLKYIGKNHTLIVNYNKNIFKTLQELNLLHENAKVKHDIVILTADSENIELLQFEIKKLKLENINVYVRFGDVLSWDRYLEVSIVKIYSIIILSDDTIEDEFIRDNNNLRILNLLFSNPEFREYLKAKKIAYKPIKSIVEFTRINHFDEIVATTTESLFVAIAPRDILSSILNLSTLDIDFFNTWSELLSFDGYEFYFIEARAYNLVGNTFKEVLLRHKNGLVVGISRTVNGEFELLLNKHNENIKDGDWLIVIAEDKESIHFADMPIRFEKELKINQPQETFLRNIVQIGDLREIKNNDLLQKKSTFVKLMPDMQEMFSKEYYKQWIYSSIKPDKIIVNLDDEVMYRLALNLKVFYSQEELEHFVFLVNDALIADQLAKSGFKNTILSNLLFSKYIAQVANQVSLHRVFKELFQKEGAEINYIDIEQFCADLLMNVENLKAQLIYSDMIYLGAILKDNSVVFEAKNLDNATKIMVLSNGEF